MKNFKFIISNFKLAKIKSLGIVFSIILFSIFCFQLSVNPAHADSAIDKAVNFLKSKQDAAGRITTGFSAPSQWSAIAFTTQGIDVSTVKNPTNSLKDFLLTDIPASQSAATDWEPRILSIVAIGSDPTNFGGVNYVQNLETFYNNNQIGDTCSLNDDIFGELALVSAGTTSNTQIKQDTLNFLISKQDPTDGGFGFSAPGCSYYSTSADMTGAAVQAMVYAKQNGLNNPGLDSAITKAKNYLIANQDSDGGFGYYGSSDTDTTGWVLMAFNALSMNDSVQVTGARNWLISQQSATDGGITAFDYGSNTYVSNASTTAQAIIGLSGKTWIFKVFTPAPIITLTPSVSPTATPTATPTPSPIPTPTPTPTVTPTPTPVVINNYLTSYYPQNPTPAPSTITNITHYLPDPSSQKPTPTPTPATTPEVLGESTDKSKLSQDKGQLLVQGINSVSWPLAFVFAVYIVVKSWERRYRK